MTTTALYARVSTSDQSIDRQKEQTWNYAVDDLDVEPSTIEVFTDTGTGRDTQRDGYQDLMARVRAGDVDRVIAHELSRLSRSMRDLATTVETIVDENECGLHILDMNLALEPNVFIHWVKVSANEVGVGGWRDFNLRADLGDPPV